MLSKMNFPMSVIPNFVIFSNFYIHLILLAISIGILNIMGYYVNIYYVQLIYFIFAAFCLLFVILLFLLPILMFICDFIIFLIFMFLCLIYFFVYYIKCSF